MFGYATSGADFMDSVSKTGSYIRQRADWLCELWQPETFVRGDVNADGIFDAADAVLLQQWLLAVPGTALVRSNAADLSADGRLDAADLSLMKRELLT
ncbi:MAG: dockerin type I repeat-containing protein [Oscillospiraceae bacterium]|nr:dockerin type I repeat-containing protein [Oscillospiraceae bacterium]